MLFEWDQAKAISNSKKHKISFEEAITVFYDTLEDGDHSLEEERFITIGYFSRDRLLVVSHADRKNRVRIISARRATTQEKKKHESQN